MTPRSGKRQSLWRASLQLWFSSRPYVAHCTWLCVTPFSSLGYCYSVVTRLSHQSYIPVTIVIYICWSHDPSFCLRCLYWFEMRQSEMCGLKLVVDWMKSWCILRCRLLIGWEQGHSPPNSTLIGGDFQDTRWVCSEQKRLQEFLFSGIERIKNKLSIKMNCAVFMYRLGRAGLYSWLTTLLQFKGSNQRFKVSLNFWNKVFL